MPTGLAAWLERLESLHPAEIELGLSRVEAVAQRLGCTHSRHHSHSKSSPGPAVVTVAGTNGKGSVVAVLEGLVRQTDLKMGSYTSPHILRYNERVRINGKPVTDEALVAAFEQVEAVRYDTPLTYFEFGTLAALQLFQSAAPDVLLLEVGLGGRLDAVNIVNPTVAVVTAVDLDHQSWLGEDRESIGAEKAGVLRPGIPVVIGDPEPPRSVLARAKELNCKVHLVGEADRERFGGFSLLPENIAAAWQAAQHLGIDCSPEQVRDVVGGLHLPGRLQRFDIEGHPLVLDVAHNPAAAARLAAHLDTHGQLPARAVFAVLSDKDIRAMIRASCGSFDGWHVTGLPGVARGAAAVDLASLLEEQGEHVKSVSQHPTDALDRALRDARPGQCIAVFGSFYLAAALLETIDKRGRE